MANNTNQLSATLRLFSSAVLKDMARRGQSELFARLVNQAGIVDGLKINARVADAFEAAFLKLRTVGYRDEYIYKAALTHKVLLGTHSLKTASMLTEFRVDTCKADLVILNGTATVYEIKSERDSLSRLSRQLQSYRKVFARAYVIAAEDHIDGVMAVAPADVGILCLTSRHRIRTIREAEDRPDRICPITLFESLRKAEATQILKRLGIPVPQVPNTRLHAELKERFRSLPPALVHAEMVGVMKQTRNLLPLSSLLSDLPPSLHAAALTIPIKRQDHFRLVSAINTPLSEAMAWG